MADGQVGTAPGTVTVTLAPGVTLAFGDWVDDRLYGSGQLENGQTSALELLVSASRSRSPAGLDSRLAWTPTCPRRVSFRRITARTSSDSRS